MADDIEKKGGNNNFAMIWNFYNQVKEVHNHFGEAASQDDLAESNADKQKRLELIRTNKVLKLNGAPNDRKPDILKLFRFIQKYFIGSITHKYEWFALRRFLERNKLLEDCDNSSFATHMNQKEWYAHADKSCEPNEMNIYNFLPQSPEKWLEEPIPVKSRATKSGIKRLYQVFHELEDNKSELYK